MTEDTILLERYVTDGDRAALEELFARHYAAVHRTILHMVHNSFDADDLSQATFLQAVRKGDQFRSRGSFRGWLLRIAVNQVRDFRRGRKQRREDQLFDLFQPQDGLEAESSRSWANKGPTCCPATAPSCRSTRRESRSACSAPCRRSRPDDSTPTAGP